MMAAMVRRVLGTMASLMLGAGLAVADDGLPRKLTLSVFPLGQERCLAQDFKTSNEKGQLTRLMLYRLLRPSPHVEYTDKDAAALVAQDLQSENGILVSVLAHFNDRKGDFTQSVNCYDNDGSILCGVDCDGGGFTASPDGERLRLKFNEYGMVVEGGCGDEAVETRMLENRHLPAPAELTPHPIDECVAADRNATLSFARELVPLRDRIEKDAWRCLKRTYSAQHLSKNPEQEVVSLAVSLTLSNKTDEDSNTDNILHATLSFRTRDGSIAKQQVECYPEAYQFTCGEEFRLKRRSGNTALLLSGSWDPQEGDPDFTRKMLGIELGDGDDVFRLDASSSEICETE